MESFTSCPNLIPQLTQKTIDKLPITLGPGKKFTAKYDVKYTILDCLDEEKTTKQEDHDDYDYTVSLAPDADNSNNDCPRDPSGNDKGCGKKDKDTKELGDNVVTDVVVKE